MSSLWRFFAKGSSRMMHCLLVGGVAFFLHEAAGRAQTTLNVTNFGARGDAIVFPVNIVSNSTLVTTTNQLSSADIGKTVEIFAGGPLGLNVTATFTVTNIVNATNLYLDQVVQCTLPATGVNSSYGNFVVNTTSNSAMITTAQPFSSADLGKQITLYSAGPLTWSTNHTDLVALIANVVNSTNIYLDRPCGATTANADAVCGTNNANAFQACINAAQSNTVIYIPNGTYLIIGSQALDPNFVLPGLFYTYPSLVVSAGSLSFLGENRTNTVLLGCGAWQNKGNWGYRGYLFAIQGPVTNNGALSFDNLTMDGGVQQGFTGNIGYPCSAATGDGWDTSHCAVIDVGTPPLPATQIFQNISVKNWRGEQFKGTVANTDGFISISNCSFTGGDASGINFSFTHNINNCYFDGLAEAMEFYQGYASNTCCFQNCVITNMGGALMAIDGATIGAPNPSYVVRNNQFYMQNGNNGLQIVTGQNLTITNNLFAGCGTAIPIGIASYYPNEDINSNIWIFNNVFSNNSISIEIEGAFASALNHLLVSNNTAYYPGGAGFASGYGWGTNMVFVKNKTYGLSYGLNNPTMMGQWYLDDGSNQFPTNWLADYNGTTNVVSYAYGMRQNVYATKANSVFVLDDTHPRQMPPRAVMVIYHNYSPASALYLSTSMTGTPISMTNGYCGTFYWNPLTSAWSPNNPSVALMPPLSFRVGGGW